MNKSKTTGRKTIAVNKRARFEYHIEERLEAGIALEGWEVKAMREGRVQFADSYVLLKDNEAFLFGCRVNPMYWSRGKVKVEIGLAKGKRQHDKRKDVKDRDWERQKGRIMKRG